MCNVELIVDPYCVEEFETKIRHSLERKYSDNMEMFLAKKTVDRFVALIGERVHGNGEGRRASGEQGGG